MTATFAVDYCDFATGKRIARCFHRFVHEDVYEEVEKHAAGIASREGIEVDIYICRRAEDGSVVPGERAGIRVRP